jgi:hypothetical protein
MLDAESESQDSTAPSNGQCAATQSIVPVLLSIAGVTIFAHPAGTLGPVGAPQYVEHDPAVSDEMHVFTSPSVVLASRAARHLLICAAIAFASLHVARVIAAPLVSLVRSDAS